MDHPHTFVELPQDCDLVIFRFLTIADLLAVRSCSRALRRRHDPERARGVWPLVRPAQLRVGTNVRLLHAAYNFTSDDIQCNEVFRNVIAAGDRPLAEWLLASFGCAIDRADNYDGAIRIACENGRLDLVQWLASLFEYRTDCDGLFVGHGYQIDVLFLACVFSHVHVARWLVSHFNIRRYPNATWTALRAYRAGHQRVAEWLFDQFGPPVTAQLFSFGEPLCDACMAGDLRTLRFLTTHFTLTATDARRRFNGALRNACARGHLEVAMWLTDQFKLTAKDARAENNYALRWACEGGQLAVVKWLVVRFELTSADARANNNWALRYACENGHLLVVRWLAARFKLTAADARAADNHALLGACKNNHLDVVQWLAAQFKLRRA